MKCQYCGQMLWRPADECICRQTFNRAAFADERTAVEKFGGKLSSMTSGIRRFLDRL